MRLCNITVLTLTLLQLGLPVARAHPVWHDFNSRSSIDSFITGSTFLLAGGVKFGVPYYLTTPLPSGTSVIVCWMHTSPCNLSSYTRLQARSVTSPYLPYPVRTAPRFSLCIMGNSFITPMNLISYMSML